MRARVVTALLVLSLCAAGCSGEGEPEQTGPTLPPVTASPTPTASPTDTEALPSAATEATPEGAAEFVRFFYAELERAYAEADPGPIAALSADECESCRNFVEALSALRDEGGRVEAFSIEVIDVVASEVDAQSPSTSAVASLNISEFIRLDADGKEAARQPASQGAVNDLRLTRSGATWQVQEITQ